MNKQPLVQIHDKAPQVDLIPTTSCRLPTTSGQYKKRLLQKYEKEQEDKKIPKCEPNQLVTSDSTDTASTYTPVAESTDVLGSKLVIQKSSFTVYLHVLQPLLSANEPFGSQQQFNAWMQHQILTWRNHWYRNPGSISSIRAPSPTLMRVSVRKNKGSFR
ncbi:unnamed protein product [Gongylonema pulchrum]|uniref:Uncharacterized protein n=1 Tax=Gongylonema pulchrum TaxID=637853 RepID=A0A183D131_9BILA|nr:unnamed protein product [Gongylonema pulchrum]